MSMTCLIRYQIDPFQRAEFGEYADRWSCIIARRGGESMAAYEGYRAFLESR